MLAHDFHAQPGQAFVPVDPADTALHALQRAVDDDDFIAFQISLGKVHTPPFAQALSLWRRQAADRLDIICGHGSPFFAGAEDSGHLRNPLQCLIKFFRGFAYHKQIARKQQLFIYLPFPLIFFLSYRARREYILQIILNLIASDLFYESVFASCRYL